MNHFLLCALFLPLVVIAALGVFCFLYKRNGICQTFERHLEKIFNDTSGQSSDWCMVVAIVVATGIAIFPSLAEWFADIAHRYNMATAIDDMPKSGDLQQLRIGSGVLAFILFMALIVQKALKSVESIDPDGE